MKTADKIRTILAAILTGCWTGMIFYLRNMRETERPVYFVWGFAVATAVFLAAAFVANQSGMKGFRDWNDGLWDRIDGLMGERMLFIHVWTLGIIIFLLAYLAYFPGLFGYDAPIQFAMYMGDMPLDAGNPLVHTLLVGGVISFGKAFLGSYQAGFALLVAIQGLFITNCMAQVFLFLKRRRVPVFVLLAGMIWIAVNPYIQVLNCNVTKDVLCGVFFVDFVIALMQILENEKNGKWDIVRFLATGVALCLFRNALIYLLVILALISLLFRFRKKELYIGFAAIIGVVEIFSFVTGHVFGLAKGKASENLSVPIQQMAHILYLDRMSGGIVEISEEEREILSELFPDEAFLLEQYKEDTADAPKAIFRVELLGEDPGRYLGAYRDIGRKNRRFYREAWLYLVQPYFNTDDNVYRTLAIQCPFPEFYQNEVYRIYPAAIRYLQGYRTYLDESVQNEAKTWAEPFLVLLLLGFLTGRMLVIKDKAGFMGILPVWFYFIGILFGPVALLRYMYPVMLAAPLLAGLLFTQAMSRDETPQEF